MLALVSASKNDNLDSFAVFDGERCVGQCMRTHRSPQGKPWFWTIFRGAPDVSDRGYAATREQAIAELKGAVALLRISASRLLWRSVALG